MPSCSKEKKPLQFSSVNELNKHTDKVIVKINSVLQCRQYCKSANDVYRKAESLYQNQDEENAYILFMRYFFILSNIKKSYEFAHSKEKFNAILKECDASAAIEKAEILNSSLEKRYEKKKDDILRKQEIEKKLAEDSKKNRKKTEHEPVSKPAVDDGNFKLPDVPDTINFQQPKEIPKTVNSTNIPNGKTFPDETLNIVPVASRPKAGFISVTDFYNLLKNKKDNLDSILIIDVRPNDEYTDARINHKCMINVPETLLQNRATINSIERKLTKDTWDIWVTRHHKSHVIIIDFDFDDETCSPTCPVYILQDILCKFEGSNDVLVVTGGFKEWHLLFPSMTSNPTYSKTPSAPALVDPLLLLQGLTYPELPSQKKPDTTKTHDRPNADQVNGPLPKTNLYPNITASENSSTKKAPTIDKLDEWRKKLNESVDDFHKEGENNEVILLPNPATRNISKSSNRNSSSFNETIQNDINEAKNNSKHLHPAEVYINDHPKNVQENSNVTNIIPGNQSLGEPFQPSGTVSNVPLTQNVSTTTKNISNDSTASRTVTASSLSSKPNVYNSSPTVIPSTDSEISTALNSSLTLPKPPLPSSHVPPIAADKTKVTPSQPPTQILSDVVSKRIETPVNPLNYPPSSKTSKKNSINPSHLSPLNQTNSKIIPNTGSAENQVNDPKPAQIKNLPTVASAPQAPTQNPPTVSRQNPSDASMQTPASMHTPKSVSKPKVSKPVHGSTSASKQPTITKHVTTYGLPYGWEKAINHETGRIYYKDHNTQRTHWTLPPEIQNLVMKTGSQPPEENSETKVEDKKKKSVTFEDVDRPSLKRSLSSPNLADMKEADKAPARPVIDRSAKPKMERPVLVDRSSKPISASRLKNMSPVYGSKGQCLTGLKNLGNTCYMNSVIQCLSNTIPLAKYFNKGLYEQHLNLRNMNSHPGEVARELAFLIIVLSAGQYRSLSPIDFKVALGRFSSQFCGYQQQDSHELLMFLLDGLHEDVNKVKVRRPIKEKSDAETNLKPDTVLADWAWDDYFSNNNSVIVDLFQGQFRSTVVCLSCGKKSKTFDAFNCLQLELTPNRSCTLEECIKSFTKPERIGGNDSWKCSYCKCYRTAEKIIEIWKLPPILIVQLKRFQFDGRWRNKIQTTVNFPLERLNMDRHVVAPTSQFSNYHLYGVINHYGSFESGHYTSYCENAYNGRWYCYDDNLVKDVTASSVKTNAAYLLFYTAVDFKNYIKR